MESPFSSPIRISTGSELIVRMFRRLPPRKTEEDQEGDDGSVKRKSRRGE